MDELIAFLKARFDEDEEVANFATKGPWQFDGLEIEGYTPPGYPSWYHTGIAAGPGFEDPDRLREEDANHIVRHEPNRVLRDIEAKRRILARYEDCLSRIEDGEYSTAEAIRQVREYEDFVLPNLASIYSDHPDYREEWAP